MYVEQIMTMLGLSDLQFALAAIGLLILILVAVLNFKYARARRKAREQGQFADDRFGREPSFTQGFTDPESADRSEPSFGDLPSAYSPQEKFVIDPRIDCVITLRFDQGISGAEILEEMSDWNDSQVQSTARWMCEGLNADIDAAEDWEELKVDSAYSELQLAIQLASRRGPIGVLELSDFCSRAQALAETLGAQIDMPSVNTMLESAKELDVMAADSDIQLSINVLFDEPCPWGNFDALMRQRGFKLGRKTKCCTPGKLAHKLWLCASNWKPCPMAAFTLCLFRWRPTAALLALTSVPVKWPSISAKPSPKARFLFWMPTKMSPPKVRCSKKHGRTVTKASWNTAASTMPQM